MKIIAQYISGNLSLLADQSIKLEGLKVLKTYPISSNTIDDKGNFKLNYAKTDFGVGFQCILEKCFMFGIFSFSF